MCLRTDRTSFIGPNRDAEVHLVLNSLFVLHHVSVQPAVGRKVRRSLDHRRRLLLVRGHLGVQQDAGQEDTHEDSTLAASHPESEGGHRESN